MQRILAASFFAGALALAGIANAAAAPGSYTLDSGGRCHGPAPKTTFANASKCKPAPAPAGATALCKDGSYSMNKTHSGSCSSHGGVAKFLK